MTLETPESHKSRSLAAARVAESHSSPTRSRTKVAVVVALLSSLLGCTSHDNRGNSPRNGAGDKAPIIVFAAANLRFAISDVAGAWQAAGTTDFERSDSAVLVFGSSGDLTTQIINGAPADVFLAADEQSIEKLSNAKLLLDSTRTVYAIGQLAVITNCTGSSSHCANVTLRDLEKREFRVVAIADPSHAPYGVAARQAMERAGIWKSVEPRLVMGANITQAYQFVETGNADAGVVALSLVLAGSHPFTLVDTSLYEPIRQSAALIATTTRRDKAIRFMHFLESPQGQSIMRGYGLAKPAP